MHNDLAFVLRPRFWDDQYIKAGSLYDHRLQRRRFDYLASQLVSVEKNATVSRLLNGSVQVGIDTKNKVLAACKDQDVNESIL